MGPMITRFVSRINGVTLGLVFVVWGGVAYPLSTVLVLLKTTALFGNLQRASAPAFSESVASPNWR